MSSRVLGAALVAIVFAFGWAGAVSAHVVVGDRSQSTAVQAVGPYNLQVVFTAPDRIPGPLSVDVEAETDAAPAVVLLTPVLSGGDHSADDGVRLRLSPGESGPYPAQIPIDQAGLWELVVRAEGVAGSGTVRIPFSVPAPERFDGLPAAVWGVAMAGGYLGIGFAALAWAGWRREAPPRWLPWMVSHGLAVAVTFAGVAAIHTALNPADPEPAAVAAARPHVNAVLSTEPAVPTAGQPFTLVLDLVDGATGRPVDDLTLYHDALVHGVLVGDDGVSFTHFHPGRVGPGRFEAATTVDRAGGHTFHAEVARLGGGTQVVSRPLRVAGAAVDAAQPAPSPAATHELDDLRIDGRVMPPSFGPGDPVTLSFHLSAAGKPVTDLEPWLGMSGHLFVRSADGAVFGHVHASDMVDRDAIEAAEPRFGPEITFTYRFPHPGPYQLWLEFKRGGRISTLPMAIDVSGEAAR